MKAVKWKIKKPLVPTYRCLYVGTKGFVVPPYYAEKPPQSSRKNKVF